MSKTLLLADDSVVIQKLVGLSFANEDIEIVSTDNGDDAVARAREVRPDVVLADVVMPGKSGYEVCEAIKQDPALAHVPVLLLTGTFEAFDEGRASAAGADGHITKPFEAQALVERVKTVIRNAARPAPETARPEASARAPRVLSADDLFADPATASAVDSVSATDDFFGRAESLDVTPSLGEADLEGPLETDFFGEGGEEIGRTSFSAGLASGPSAGASPGIAPLPPLSGRGTPTSEAVPEPASARVSRAPTPPPDRFDELDFSAPPALPPIAARELDLDAVFDTGSPLPATSPSSARGSFDRVEPGDSNASTATGSFAPAAPVTDLDLLLEQPGVADAAIPFEGRSEQPPEAPRALDLRPHAPQPADDLDFGFDVSEQSTIAKVDLLEESFSSLLDVSDSQLLADPPPLETPAEASRPAEIPIGAFDVSASDLPPAFEPLVAPPPPPLGAPPIASPGDSGFALLLDVVADEPKSAVPEPPPIPTAIPTPIPKGTTTPRATTASEAVAHLTPVLQQHVQETLEKVAWEAFSDLSDTIVKQVMERVERIAWEVIPQMAETLVREEIRKMKGEED